MPTLYYAPNTCALACHIVLEWIGAPYDIIEVDLADPEYRKVNPAGAVPAFKYDEGGVLTQNDAILHYLANKHPGAGLLDGRTLETAAEVDRWCNFLTGDLHPAFYPVFSPKRYTTRTDETGLKAVSDAGLAWVANRVALMDDHLTGREWLAGDKRTIADAYATPMFNWCDMKLEGGLDAYPAVAAHFRRMTSDSGALRAMQAEGTPRRGASGRRSDAVTA